MLRRSSTKGLWPDENTWLVLRRGSPTESRLRCSCKVRNEIAVLKRVSMGHQNILTLVDYFETMNNCASANPANHSSLDFDCEP
jgi:hypothetical protein